MRVSQSMSIRCAREVNPICCDCLASFATRCCFVDTVLEFLCIRRLSQQRFHNPTPRFPPRGPGGPVGLSQVLSRRYDLLPSFYAALGFLRLALPRGAPWALLPPCQSATTADREYFIFGHP